MDEIIGKWFGIMKQYEDMQPYSDEWWEAMINSLIFIPKEQRAFFMDGLIMAGSVM